MHWFSFTYITLFSCNQAMSKKWNENQLETVRTTDTQTSTYTHNIGWIKWCATPISRTTKSEPIECGKKLCLHGITTQSVIWYTTDIQMIKRHVNCEHEHVHFRLDSTLWPSLFIRIVECHPFLVQCSYCRILFEITFVAIFKRDKMHRTREIFFLHF